jgi:hypothetical protein
LSIPDVDCADFRSSSRFIEDMAKVQQDYVLTHFYTMQLREYQSLLDVTAMGMSMSNSKLTKTTDGEAERRKHAKVGDYFEAL